LDVRSLRLLGQASLLDARPFASSLLDVRSLRLLGQALLLDAYRSQAHFWMLDRFACWGKLRF